MSRCHERNDRRPTHFVTVAWKGTSARGGTLPLDFVLCFDPHTMPCDRCATLSPVPPLARLPRLLSLRLRPAGRKTLL